MPDVDDEDDGEVIDEMPVHSSSLAELLADMEASMSQVTERHRAHDPAPRSHPTTSKGEADSDRPEVTRASERNHDSYGQSEHRSAGELAGIADNLSKLGIDT